MTFDDVIAPVSRSQFCGEYLSHRYCIVREQPGRFRGLVTWDEVNEVLSHARFRTDGSRLRLILHGQVIDPPAYLTFGRESVDSYVDASRLEKLLRAGATLAVNSVDELFPEVGRLAESFQEQLRIYVLVNLYIGMGTSHGFDLHWDDHDTVILQVHGRKRWQVYEPTLLHPLRSVNSNGVPKPTGAPAWEGLLEDGDMLYMPRGWWHVATPIAEPTLHLTVTCKHRTGVGLLNALISDLGRHEELRQDVPHLQSREHQAAYVARLRELVTSTLSDDAIERFMRNREEEVVCRPRVILPRGTASHPEGAESEAALRLTRGVQLHVTWPTDGLTAQVSVGSANVTCDAKLVPALRLLRLARPTTLEEMRGLVEPGSHAALRACVQELMARDMVWQEPRRALQATS